METFVNHERGALLSRCLQLSQGVTPNSCREHTVQIICKLSWIVKWSHRTAVEELAWVRYPLAWSMNREVAKALRQIQRNSHVICSPGKRVHVTVSGRAQKKKTTCTNLPTPRHH